MALTAASKAASSALVLTLDPAAQLRLAAALQEHHAFVWRCTRRFGVDPAFVDDVVQEAFIVLARRLADVELGRERAFLTQAAVYLASNFRRARRRKPEPIAVDFEERLAAEQLNPEQALEASRRRELLDRALDTLAEDQRAVFVLSEIDGLSRSEIAELLGLPAGTVASRLRAARERFASSVAQLFEPLPLKEPTP